jgi:hypothetical protein
MKIEKVYNEENQIYNFILSVRTFVIPFYFVSGSANAKKFRTHSISVPDPNPDPPDPRVFWPPGSGSTSQRYGSGPGSGCGSGSFYHHAKIIRKILNPTIL